MLNYRYNLQKLLNTLEKSGELEVFVADILRFNQVCEENYGIREILFDEQIAPESKSKYFQEVCTDIVGADFKKFILQLIANNDLLFFEKISGKFIETLRIAKDCVFAEVLSAVELAPDQLNIIRQELERLENKKIYLQHTVSKDVLGGFVVKCGTKILDLSLHAGLEQLKTVLV